MKIRIISTVLVALFLTLSTGCSKIHMYHRDVQQGNILNDEAIAQLRPGMSEQQVLFLMGTPVLTNTFQPNRWDYVYSYKQGSGVRQERHVTLFFNKGTLQKIQKSPLVTTSK